MRLSGNCCVKYSALFSNQPSVVEAHFDEAVRKMLKPGPMRAGDV